MEKNEILKELLKHRYAHRGFHEKPKLPENSMEAFRRALMAGFGIELDVHLTRDGGLAVLHDANLKRTCGADRIVEELTLAEAQEYFLEESTQTIPDFEEVLKLVDGQVPMIVELKADSGVDEDALCRRVMKALDGYRGLYCVESFSPAVVKWFRKNRPEIVRGQLSGAMRKTGTEMPAIADFLLKNLWVNLWGKPDFVAYRFEDRDVRRFRKYKGGKFFWTIRSREDMLAAEAMGAAVIFERFDPRQEDGKDGRAEEAPTADSKNK